VKTSTVGSGSAGLNTGVYNTSLPTLTNGQFAPISLDVNGRVIIGSMPGIATFNTSEPTYPTGTFFAPSADANGNMFTNIFGAAHQPMDASNNAAPPTNSLSTSCGAQAQGTNPTASTGGNTQRVMCDQNGAINVGRESNNLWTCGLKGIAAAYTVCQNAPAAGLRLYVTDIFVDTTTATPGTYAFESNTLNACSGTATPIFPATATTDRYTASALGAPPLISFHTPLVLPAATALCMIGTVTNTITAQVNGYVAP
jgi:hypothetical protein